MAHFHDNALIGASGQGGYQIERSLRFNSADSAYLNRTPASAGNRRTFTWSGWFKVGNHSSSGEYYLLCTNGTADNTFFYIQIRNNQLRLGSYNSGSFGLFSTQLFRDPSAWYHLVVAVDTTQVTAANRAKAYVNGTEITTWSTANYPSQNYDLGANDARAHAVGAGYASGSPYAYWDGLLTECHLIDGQALTPSSFGETDTITGVWKPKKYIHTTSSATSWDYRAYSGTGSPGSWSSMTSVSSGNALGANSSSGTSNPSVAIYSAGAKSKIFRFTGGSGDSRTINVWSSDDGVTWTSQASTTFSVLGGSGHQTTGQYAVYQFANGDFFSSSSYAVTVNDINSFYLKFADNSGTTSTTLGKDSSGNGNNWTPNNFSVTAGAGNDSLIDTPTPYADGGNGRGNYCTLNPLDNTATLSNGNLTQTATAERSSRSTFQIPSSGLWYAEATATSTTNGSTISCGFGLAAASVSLTANSYNLASAWNLYSSNFAFINRNGTPSSSLGFTLTAGDVVQIAVDPANNRAWIGRNNTWYDSGTGTTGNPGSGTNPTVSSLPAGLFVFANTFNQTWDVNFGQRAFAYTPPSGFKALNTQNLPEPSIKKPNQWMDINLATGNNSTQTITNAGGFQPDLVWMKIRSASENHILYDSARGTDNFLVPNLTNAAASGGGQGLTSFNSNGFTLGNINPNYAGSPTFVAWQWKESATPGFDIVTYTGTGVARTIAHSLGVAPSMMIVKRRTTAGGDWNVYHSATGATQRLFLNTNAAAQTTSVAWNDTAPTSSVFTVGTGADVNQNGDTHVAYLWSEVAGFSKFGSYVANNSTDGPFVYCGFRPKWVLCKDKDRNAMTWIQHDSARSPYNAATNSLAPSSASAEPYDTASPIDILSNGFKFRGGSSSYNNYLTDTYIFAAFAESPFKYSLAR